MEKTRRPPTPQTPTTPRTRSLLALRQPNRHATTTTPPKRLHTRPHHPTRTRRKPPRRNKTSTQNMQLTTRTNPQNKTTKNNPQLVKTNNQPTPPTQPPGHPSPHKNTLLPPGIGRRVRDWGSDLCSIFSAVLFHACSCRLFDGLSRSICVPHAWGILWVWLRVGRIRLRGSSVARMLVIGSI